MKNLTLLSLMFIGQMLFASENLLQNGGFESESDAAPQGCRLNFASPWVIYLNSGRKYASARLSDDCVEGKKSLELEVIPDDEKKKNAAAVQDIPVKCGLSYKLQFYYKTVDGGGAFLTSCFKNVKGEQLRKKNFNLPDSEGEWRLYSNDFKVVEDGVLQLGLENLSSRKGAVLYDNVILKSDEATEKKEAGSSYNFDNMILEKEWAIVSGGWTIKDWMLTAQGPGKLMLLNALPENVRIEYDCTSDSPCDISALLYADEKGEGGFYFGFGSNNNTENVLAKGRNKIASEKNNLILLNQNNHVIVERNGKFLRMNINGNKVFDKLVSDISPDGKYLGFYVYGTAQIDNLRIIPLKEASVALKEPDARVSNFTDFRDGKLPDWITAATGNFRVEDQYNWREKVIEDKALVLSGKADLEFPVSDINNGLFELDMMMLEKAASPVIFSFLGDEGKVMGAISLGGKGLSFFSEGTWKNLDTDITFPHHYEKPQIRLLPEQWYTLRLDFDAAGTFRPAFLNYYYWPGESPDCVWNYMPLASSLPLEKGAIKAIRVSFDKGSYCFDNITLYGPCHPLIVKGMDRRFSTKKLLSLDYIPRRNPYALHTAGFRHYKVEYGRTAPVFPSVNKNIPSAGDGLRFSRIFVSQAMLKDKAEIVARSVFYTETAGKFDDGLKAEYAKLRQDAEETYQALDQLYRLYAAAYIGALPPEDFRKIFEEKASALEKKIQISGAGLDEILKRIAGKNPASIKLLPRCEAGKSAKDYAWRDNSYWSKGKQAFLFPEVHSVDFYKYLQFRPILDLQGCWRMVLKTANAKEGEYSNVMHSIEHMKNYSNRNEDYTFQWGLNQGAHSMYMAVAPWWAEKYGTDKDIYMRDENGKIAGMPENAFWYKRGSSGPIAHLNYWHPEVKKMFADMYRQAAKEMFEKYPGRVKDIQLGGEMSHEVYGKITGYGPSALSAFKAYLKGIYNDIAGLNKAWGTDYRSFDEIKQPSQAVKEYSGLNYEFNRFRHKGYFDWQRSIISSFLQNHPGVSVSINENQPFWGGDCFHGFDVVEAFKTYDLIENHNFRKEWVAEFRRLDSLAKAYGKRIGFQEMCSGPGEVLDREVARNFKLAYNLGFMTWGCQSNAQWYGVTIGWDPQPVWLDHTLGFSMIDYSAAAIPLSYERVRRLGYAALNFPTITPDAALLEVSSSFYNSPPQGYALGTRAWQARISALLDNSGWNFAYLFETPLYEKKQAMDGIRTIIVPAAFCCPEWLQDTLVSFTEKGGTLIMLGPCGVYDQYGKKNGRLLNKAFPGISWSYDASQMTWQSDNMEKLPSEPCRKCYIAKANIGTGKVFLFNSMAGLDANKFNELMDKTTQHTVSWTSDDDKIKTVFRSDGKKWYVYITNFDLRNARRTTVAIAKPFDVAADIGGYIPVSVPLSKDKNGVSFSVSLAPAETTLIALE